MLDSWAEHLQKIAGQKESISDHFRRFLAVFSLKKGPGPAPKKRAGPIFFQKYARHLVRAFAKDFRNSDAFDFLISFTVNRRRK